MLKPSQILFLWSSLVCALLTGEVQAQIIITADEIPATIGEKFSQYFVEDTTSPGIPVNLGSAGPGQSWSFDPVQYPGGTAVETEVVDPAATPYADSFSVADFAWKQANPFEPFTWFQYFDLTETELSFVGAAVIQADTQWAETSKPARKLALFPLAYGSAWTQSGIDTTTVDSGGVSVTMIVQTVLEDTVDAWGTIELPLGTYPCLRIQELSSVTFTMLLSGFPLGTWTVRIITYNWVGENTGVLATAQSRTNETDLNFTHAKRIVMRVGTPTSVKDEGAVVNREFYLHSNYPNPFTVNGHGTFGNPETRIQFETRQPAQITIEVYNMLGQVVRTLCDQPFESGTHQLNWDGRNDSGETLAAGVYLLRMRALRTNAREEIVQTRKMLLAR